MSSSRNVIDLKITRLYPIRALHSNREKIRAAIMMRLAGPVIKKSSEHKKFFLPKRHGRMIRQESRGRIKSDIVHEHTEKSENVIQIMKNRKNRVLTLYKNNDQIMTILANQSPLCDKIGIKNDILPINLIKELGKGKFGQVWEAEVNDYGTYKYIAAKIPLNLLKIIERTVSKRETIEKYSQRESRIHGINESLIIKLNGGNSNRLIRPGDIILWPHFAVKCLTIKSEKFKYNTSDDSLKSLIVPEGSYLCSNSVFSEYLIGLLCGELYTKRINNVMSINFINMLDLSSCPETERDLSSEQKEGYDISSFIFQQKIEGGLLEKNSPFLTKEIGPVVLQILHAIECYQRAYHINHGDLHIWNILYGETPEIWNGENVQSADYFEYRIDGDSFYIPSSRYVIKIADFGHSAKYSSPMILTRGRAGGKSGSIPNFYSPAYDIGTALITLLFELNFLVYN